MTGSATRWDGENHTLLPWSEVDAIAGERVDRRRCYIVSEWDGVTELNVACQCTAACSGCNETPEGHHPADKGTGCHECGYSGKSVHRFGVPYASFVKIEREARADKKRGAA